MSIVLGNKVRDIVTGIEGIATARVEYLNGCVQFCIQPKSKKDATKIDCMYVDEGQIEVIDQGIAVIQKRTGGVMDNTPPGIGLARN